MTDIHKMAAEEGFTTSYLIPMSYYQDWLHRRKDGAFHSNTAYIEGEPKVRYGWANAILLLIWGYDILPSEAVVASYYPASNAAYHAMNRLRDRLNAMGVQAQRADIPLRAVALEAGIGTLCHNALLALDALGTRFAMQGLALKINDAKYSKTEGANTCEDCKKCQQVCPGGAITDEGYDFKKCVRAYMDDDLMPKWVMEGMSSLLGCELCQVCCPLNEGVKTATMSEDNLTALSLEKILGGDCSETLQLVGKNMNKHSKLKKQAAIMAANLSRRELLDRIIELNDAATNEGERAAYQYAIDKLSRL